MKKLPLLLAAIVAGPWAIEITTSRGSCDPKAMAYVVIENGRVTMAPTPFSQGGQMPLAGVVRGDGLFRARVGAVSATGRVQGTSGAGTWIATEQACSGTWKAWRR